MPIIAKSRASTDAPRAGAEHSPPPRPSATSVRAIASAPSSAAAARSARCRPTVGISSTGSGEHTSTSAIFVSAARYATRNAVYPSLPVISRDARGRSSSGFAPTASNRCVRYAVASGAVGSSISSSFLPPAAPLYPRICGVSSTSCGSICGSISSA